MPENPSKAIQEQGATVAKSPDEVKAPTEAVEVEAPKGKTVEVDAETLAADLPPVRRTQAAPAANPLTEDRVNASMRERQIQLEGRHRRREVKDARNQEVIAAEAAETNEVTEPAKPVDKAPIAAAPVSAPAATPQPSPAPTTSTAPSATTKK